MISDKSKNIYFSKIFFFRISLKNNIFFILRFFFIKHLRKNNSYMHFSNQNSVCYWEKRDFTDAVFLRLFDTIKN